jgi:hypothetical protein
VPEVELASLSKRVRRAFERSAPTLAARQTHHVCAYISAGEKGRARSENEHEEGSGGEISASKINEFHINLFTNEIFLPISATISTPLESLSEEGQKCRL